jgi:hypothetical protein
LSAHRDALPAERPSIALAPEQQKAVASVLPPF